MFNFFNRSNVQKELYFQLTSAVQTEELSEKVKGVYVIFKDDLCLYVGQSKNIPSRLATHLSGKYESTSKILIFACIEDHQDLIENEKYLINKFKPIENVLVDYNQEVNIDKLIDVFHDKEKGADVDISEYVDLTIYIKGREIFIHDSNLLPDIYDMDTRVQDIFIMAIKAKREGINA